MFLSLGRKNSETLILFVKFRISDFEFEWDSCEGFVLRCKGSYEWNFIVRIFAKPGLTVTVVLGVASGCAGDINWFGFVWQLLQCALM